MHTTKKQEINFLNVGCCLLVVLIHVIGPTLVQVEKGTWQYVLIFIPWRLAAFVVPCFIFLSAIKLFAKYENQHVQYGKFILSRIKKIYVPYILWVGIYYLYFIREGVLLFQWQDLGEYIVLGNLVSPFYFVVIIMQFYLLLPFWMKVLKRYAPVVMIPLAILLTLLFKQYLPDMVSLMTGGIAFEWNDRVLTTYMMYWVIGGYVGLHYEAFIKLLDTHKGFILGQAAVFTVLESVFGVMQFAKGIYIPFLEMLHVLYILAIIMGLCVVAKCYGQKVAQLKVVRSLNQSSYAIYLSHSLLIFMVNDWLGKLGVTQMGMTLVLRCVTVYGCILLISGLLMWYRDVRSKKHTVTDQSASM
ncbi:MAG: acyltransferase family protein [Cellulosilyticaceae bacterium]